MTATATSLYVTQGIKDKLVRLKAMRGKRQLVDVLEDLCDEALAATPPEILNVPRGTNVPDRSVAVEDPQAVRAGAA